MKKYFSKLALNQCKMTFSVLAIIYIVLLIFQFSEMGADMDLLLRVSIYLGSYIILFLICYFSAKGRISRKYKKQIRDFCDSMDDYEEIHHDYGNYKLSDKWLIIYKPIVNIVHRDNIKEIVVENKNLIIQLKTNEKLQYRLSDAEQGQYIDDEIRKWCGMADYEEYSEHATKEENQFDFQPSGGYKNVIPVIIGACAMAFMCFLAYSTLNSEEMEVNSKPPEVVFDKKYDKYIEMLAMDDSDVYVDAVLEDGKSYVIYVENNSDYFISGDLVLGDDDENILFDEEIKAIRPHSTVYIYKDFEKEPTLYYFDTFNIFDFNYNDTDDYQVEAVYSTNDDYFTFYDIALEEDQFNLNRVVESSKSYYAEMAIRGEEYAEMYFAKKSDYEKYESGEFTFFNEFEMYYASELSLDEKVIRIYEIYPDSNVEVAKLKME